MKLLLWLFSLTFIGITTAIQKHDYVLFVRQASTRIPILPSVPAYNFTMPVDHFTPSDTRTYNNRYFVNDTFYQPGGPVILYDGGESGFYDLSIATVMAEYNGTQSAVMRLASRLNGIVIAWEHRYYGYSQPFAVNENTGLPIQGAAAYKYLTLEQSLEDLVYFANRFNTTTLSKNSKVQSTANLDPYHTPWICVGGSYPGARAAWIRQRNPEIFYASWASSAPTQARKDGSIYFNQISRSLPSNCTKDLQGVSAWLDQVLSSNNQFNIRAVKAALYLVDPSTSADSDVTPAFRITSTAFMRGTLQGLFDEYQNRGARQTVQIFCNYMQQFDAASYLRARQLLATSADERDVALVAFQNQGRAAPNANGIVAANGQDGGEIGFAAFVYAYRWYEIYRIRLAASTPRTQVIYTRGEVDTRSWIWQTLDQFGYFQWTNTSTPFFASKFLDENEFYQRMLTLYPSFSTSDFPKSVNTTYPLSLGGGWNMKVSNTMFTNGELDPWRAFSVHSQEKNAGAPLRPTTTDIPKCNTPASGNNVFGLVYPGAVHCEDLSYTPSYPHASEESVKPITQGLELFVKAYNVWQPCFNSSRDTIRNGKGVDGNGNSASGTSISSSTSNTGSSGGNASKNTATVSASSYGTWSTIMLSLVLVVFASL